MGDFLDSVAIEWDTFWDEHLDANLFCKMKGEFVPNILPCLGWCVTPVEPKRGKLNGWIYIYI